MTDIIILVDTSPSIYNHLDSYTNCINNIINTQKEISPDSRFTLYTFNNSVYTVCINTPVKDLSPISNSVLTPDGCTALYSAVHFVASRNANTRFPTIFIVMTDGEDNCSFINAHTVRTIIEKLKQSGYWDFIFLGASVNSNSIGKNMGIDKCILYNNTPNSIYQASQVINIAISKATAIARGVSNRLSVCDIPLDVRDITNSINKMKIR